MNGKHFLIVDQDFDAYTQMRDLLNELAHRTRWAYDLRTATLLLKQGAFDAVLLDLASTCREALDAGEWIQSQAANLPIVLMNDGQFGPSIAAMLLNKYALYLMPKTTTVHEIENYLDFVFDETIQCTQRA